MTITNILLIFCQLLKKIMSDFVRILWRSKYRLRMKVQSLAFFLICKLDTLSLKEIYFVWQDLFLVNQC